MKKLIALILAALLLTGAAGAENAPDLFAQIQGQTFEFSSGAGGWSTELIVGENGTFTGNFHDSEMGETGEGYPDGSLYGCTFHGQFSDPAAIDEYSWRVQISVEPDEGQAPEAIEDGIRYVTTAPYGVEKADSVIFFRPGTPVDHLPEGFMIWSHLQEIDPGAAEIPYYAIWNETDEAGFIAYPGDASLPAYTYTGEDPIEGAVANMLASGGFSGLYLTEPGSVMIPCLMIHKTEMTDDACAKVYCTFWILNYVKKGEILENISGGQHTAVILLEGTDGNWQVASVEEARDGDDYAEDVRRFSNGDRELEKMYFDGCDLGTKQDIRIRFIKAYVDANHLDITAYQDYGWDPVNLQ